MSHQHPLIALPRKTTTETDFSTPLRHAIAHTYGERPDTYAQELGLLARCRADAVAGAGSDTTARDLLFKYFGQLELLELRFAQQKISFDWHDAFTGKSTQQTSLAFEKASVLHLLASHLSSHAASQPRIGNPEGIKRAYTSLRQAAGLLTFIHENFLHAPSTDLSREVLTFCASLMTLQAAQVFLERCIVERKPPSLTSRMCQALVVGYTALVEDSAQFQGKGILDRAWLDVITIRAKYYASLAAWYRATHEQARGEYGNATSRFGLAHSLAHEAQKLAKEFTYSFIPSINSAAAQANFYYPSTPTAPGPPPTLPADAATCLLEITQAHLATALESKTTAERDNDLIYHAIPIQAASLPAIDPLPLNTLASAITIQEIYAQPEVTALIGPDIFRRLVPLEVHEQASVYSEEKAKLVRGEVERCDIAEGEIAAALNDLDPRARIAKIRTLGSSNSSAVPAQVERWAEQISAREQAGGAEQMLRRLDDTRRGCEQVIDQLSRDLDDESRECERMRVSSSGCLRDLAADIVQVKYSHRWSQQPSGTYTRALRGDLKARSESLAVAAQNDARISSLWRSIAGDVGLLAGPDHRRSLERAFAQQGAHVDLLDVDVEAAALNADEQRTVDALTDEVEANMKRLDSVRNEQAEVLRDLKQKVQADDVSHLLLLNRGRTQESGPDPSLFATELEKFKPYQARLAAAIQAQKDVLEDVAQALRKLETVPGVKRLMRERSGDESRTRDIEARFRNAWEGYEDVRVGLEYVLSSLHVRRSRSLFTQQGSPLLRLDEYLARLAST